MTSAATVGRVLHYPGPCAPTRSSTARAMTIRPGDAERVSADVSAARQPCSAPTAYLFGHPAGRPGALDPRRVRVIAQFDGTTRMIELTRSIRLEHFGPSPALPLIEENARRPLCLSRGGARPGALCREALSDPNATVSRWAKRFLEGEDGDTFATLTHICRASRRG
jgi:hypothetical protein